MSNKTVKSYIRMGCTTSYYILARLVDLCTHCRVVLNSIVHSEGCCSLRVRACVCRLQTCPGGLRRLRRCVRVGVKHYFFSEMIYGPTAFVSCTNKKIENWFAPHVIHYDIWNCVLPANYINIIICHYY